MAGPLLRNLPKSAKNIIDRPKIVVMALAVMASPTWPKAWANACGGANPRVDLLAITRNQKQAEVSACPEQDRDDEDLRRFEDLEIEPLHAGQLPHLGQ